MNYKRLIGISTGTSWVSKAIQSLRQSVVFDNKKEIPTHVFIFYGEILGQGLIGEATDPVIRLAPLDIYINKNKHKKVELYEVPDYIADEKIDEALNELLPYIGKWYSFIQLFGYAWIWVGQKLGRQWHNPIKNAPDQAVCSDYGVQFLQKIGYKDPELMSMDINDVAPDNILKSMRANCRLAAVSDFDQFDLTWIKK